VTPLTRVALPALSSVHDFVRLNTTLVRLQRVIAYGLLGVISALASLADPLIPLLLGADWRPMIPLVQIMCVGAAFQALGYVYYWAFLALGRAGTLLVSELPGRALMVLGAVATAALGTEWVAWVMSCGLFLIWLTTSTIFAGRVGIHARHLVTVALRPTALFVCATAFTIVVKGQLFSGMNSSNLLVLVATISVWCLAVVLGCTLPTIRRDVRTAWSDARAFWS
jgi:O-antigen/teichoic acid export membrane protein